MPQTVISRSEAETAALGRDLAARIEPGSTLLLFGDLGAGKTAFVRGLANGLGIDPSIVTSPTFTLVQEYRGRLTLYHVDLYRVSAMEAEDLGLEELATSSSIVAIEWGEKLRGRIDRAIQVSIEDAGDDVRRITVL